MDAAHQRRSHASFRSNVRSCRIRRFTDRHRSARSRALPSPPGDHRIWCGKMAIYPKLIVPLQIDLAITRHRTARRGLENWRTGCALRPGPRCRILKRRAHLDGSNTAEQVAATINSVCLGGLIADRDELTTPAAAGRASHPHLSNRRLNCPPSRRLRRCRRTKRAVRRSWAVAAPLRVRRSGRGLRGRWRAGRGGGHQREHVVTAFGLLGHDCGEDADEHAVHGSPSVVAPGLLGVVDAAALSWRR